MLTRKSLVILAGLLIIAALMVLISWNPATVTAQGPAATPPPPVAVLKVVPVPGVVTDKNAITATIKIISDTAVGPSNVVVAAATTGGSNVPVNVPIHLAVSAQDPKNTGKPTWSLTKPSTSKAAIKDPAAAETEFTPDVIGAYYVQVTLKNDAGVASAPQFAFFNAGTYIGVNSGNCKQCHPEKTAEWAKTGHAQVFSLELDNGVDGPLGVKPSAAGFITHYSESCAACHTTGWYPGITGTGGYFDAKAKANWTFPTWKQIDEVFTKKTPSNWAATPAEIKDMGNIGCEVCHGPAGQHVKDGAKVMEASWDNAVCNQCHGTRGSHSRGMQIAFSKHSDAESSAWTHPIGPEEQACVRCHSGKGFVSFLQNPTNMAAWENEEQTLSCAACHEPHSEANAYQLRIVGKPVELPFTLTKDVGLSATCYECHNNRSNGDAFAKATPGVSYPHYASDAEMISDTGGVTYGQTVPNSPHGAMVGAAPIPNPAYDGKDTSVAKFMYTPAGSDKGNTPGGCVVCHMPAAVTTANDPLQFKVGGHSFNTVTPDGKAIYNVSCKSCHGDLKTFNMPAKADYDGNGKAEGVQDEVKGLLNVVWKQLEAKGVKKMDTGYPYATLPADADQKIKNAWYNYRYVYGVMWGAAGPGNEGKAAAIHNFKRSVSLLQLSIKDLSGALPGGMSELK